MADNLTLNSGSGGSDLATDDVTGSGPHYQKIKLFSGADTSTTPVNVDNGVAANAMRVTIASDSTGTVAVTNTGTFAVQAAATNAGTFVVQEDGAALTALQLIDDVVATDDTTTHATGTTKGVSIMAAATPTDGSVASNDIGSVAMSLDRRLHVDAQIVGTDSALDVSGATVTVDGAGGTFPVTNTGLTDLAAAINASRMDVNLAASAATVTVDGSAVTQPVSNAGLTELAAAINASRMDVNLAASGATVTVDNGGTFAVQAAATNAGTFVVQEDGAALTALQLIDDVVATDDTTTHATGSTKGVGIMAAATPTDGSVTANDIGSVAMSTDRRLHVDAQIVGTDSALDVSGATVTVDNGGTFAVQSTLQAGTAAFGKLAANSGVDIGDVDVTSISAGANLIGDVGLSGARTSGGTTIFRSIDLDETEEEVKNTGGQVYWIHAMNLGASTLFLKFYNATAATVVVGTTTPVLTFPLATQGDTNGAGFTLSIPNGIAFGTAITVAATSGIADADTGDPGTNTVILNMGYA